MGVAQGRLEGPRWPDMAQMYLNLAGYGPNVPKSGQNLAESGRIMAKLGQIRPYLALYGSRVHPPRPTHAVWLPPVPGLESMGGL